MCYYVLLYISLCVIMSCYILVYELYFLVMCYYVMSCVVSYVFFVMCYYAMSCGVLLYYVLYAMVITCCWLR